MNDDLYSMYVSHLGAGADARPAWALFAAQFLEQDGPPGSLGVVVVDETTMTGKTTKLTNVRLRLGDLLSCSARTAAALVGLGFSSLDPEVTLPLAVMQGLLFVREAKKLQSIDLTERDVRVLLWMHEHSSTWVDESECLARHGDGSAAALRRLEVLGCVATEDGKWRVIERVRLNRRTGEGDV